MNPNEWLDMNEFKRMNWNEWIEMNDLSNSSSKTEKNTAFYDFRWNRALATVPCAFCRPHRQKVVTRQFLTIFMWNRALASVSCTFSTIFRIEARNCGNRDLPVATTDSHFTRKTYCRVWRPKVFSAVNSRVPDRPNFPTTWWRCDWHDDVVDMMIEMMMWLPWWWDSKPLTIVRNSEVS